MEESTSRAGAILCLAPGGYGLAVSGESLERVTKRGDGIYANPLCYGVIGVNTT